MKVTIKVSDHHCASVSVSFIKLRVFMLLVTDQDGTSSGVQLTTAQVDLLKQSFDAVLFHASMGGAGEEESA